MKKNLLDKKVIRAVIDPSLILCLQIQRRISGQDGKGRWCVAGDTTIAEKN